MGIRELRDTLTQTIRRVRGGETIEVTHHGAPVAVIAPAPVDRIDVLVATGEVSAGRPLERRARRFPVTGAQTASQALEDDRAER
jgi:prevent-host-death family protein